jgi:hypothetical protein
MERRRRREKDELNVSTSSPTNGQEIRATGGNGRALLAESEQEDVITLECVIPFT